MKLRSLSRHWAARGGVAATALVTLGAVLQVTSGGASHPGSAAAAPPRPSTATPAGTAAARGSGAVLTGATAAHAAHGTTATAPAPANPYAPAYHHTYRHGAVPTRATAQKMQSWLAQHPAAAAAAGAKKKKKQPSINKLVYGGGIDGIGVTTAPEKVYLVFWGSQWGTQSTSSNGDVTLSGDPSGEAPYLQEFLKGLGTGGERWSGVMTQYCQGVKKGATSCPAGSSFAAYPAAGVLAGVWADGSAEPTQATGTQLAAEAVRAAAHFGNTTKASNRNVQYVIASPAGLDPDQWLEQGFCAWHDWSGDPTLSGGGSSGGGVKSPYGDLAFTNLPYLNDAPNAACGQNFVNPGSNGNLDGVSIVEGHEYAETVTDQDPPGGWTYASTNSGLAGEENGDLCAWISPGTPGGSANLATATGVFAVQSTWANDDGSKGGCETGHNIVGASKAGAVKVAGPGNRNTLLGQWVGLRIRASESGQSSFTYSATGLPPGVSLDPATGAITGRPNTTGSYQVVAAAADSAGGSGQAAFTWTVSRQLLGNPGFESGSLKPWSASKGVLQRTSTLYPARTGAWLAKLDGAHTSHTDTLAQKVRITGGGHATLSFYLYVHTNDPMKKVYDTLTVQVLNSKGKVVKTLATFSNKNKSKVYGQHSYSLNAYLGQTVTIKFTGRETLKKHNTAFLIDDTGLYVH